MAKHMRLIRDVVTWKCDAHFFFFLNHLTYKCQVDEEIFDFHMFGICNVKRASIQQTQ